VTHINKGKPFPLGSSLTSQGVNFSIIATNAEHVEILLFEREDSISPKSIFKLDQTHNKGPYWHAEIKNLDEGCIYAFRVKQKNNEINNNYEKKVLLDPCSRGITGWGSYKREIAFVGASGAGKSTMLALILKFITPNNGDIFIDDKNLNILNTNDIRKNIALVQQQPFLFSGKIIDVIRMGRNYTKEEVIESAKKSNAHNFIQKLPEKYETEITERGSNFSGGQLQRIAIARAILGNPSILLLDEATSALDAESESEVQEGLNRAMKNRTVIVIAHRLATTQEADKIVVFNKGEIIEIGKHKDLVNKKGINKELCEKQLIKKL